MSKKISKRFLLAPLLLFLLTPLIGISQDYLVNDKTTFLAALAKLSPGDKMIIAEGNYSDWGLITIDVNGSAALPITISGNSNNTSEFSGDNIGFIITGQHLHIENIAFKDRSQSSVETPAILWLRGASHIQLRQNRFDNIDEQRLIAISGGDAQTLIANIAISRSHFNGINSQLLYIDNSEITQSTGLSFRDNTIENSTSSVAPSIEVGNSWQLAERETYFIVANNTFTNVSGTQYLLNIGTSRTSINGNRFINTPGISLGFGNQSEVTKNMFININDRGLGALRITGKQHLITNNVIIGGLNSRNGITLEYGLSSQLSAQVAAAQNLIANNTLYNLRTTGIFLGTRRGLSIGEGSLVTAPSNNVFMNNIITGRTGILLNQDGSDNNTIDNNLFFASAAAFEGFTGTEPVLSDPQFKATTALNLELSDTSPALGRGKALTEVNEDFLSQTRTTFCCNDLGAFEQLRDTASPPEQASFNAFFEAENGQLGGAFELESDLNASGRQYVLAPEDSGDNYGDFENSRADYVEITIAIPETKTYTIWANTLARDAARNSFFVTLNDTLINETFFVRQSCRWVWNQVEQIEIPAGEHSLKFHRREDGTKLDAILISDQNDLFGEVSGIEPDPEHVEGSPDCSDDENVDAIVSRRFEAENLTKTLDFIVSEDNEAIAGAFIESPQDAENNLDDSSAGGPGSLLVETDIVTGGVYSLWVRVKAPSTSSNSFYLTKQNALISEWEPEPDLAWQWYRIAGFYLHPGPQTWFIRKRESGTQIDSLVLTNDTNFDGTVLPITNLTSENNSL